MPENTLPYPINDADNHFNEPPDCFERYIDPQGRDLAIRSVTAPDGKRMQLFAGKPSKFHAEPGDLLEGRARRRCSATPRTSAPAAARCRSEEGEPELGVVPGMLLNRLNPLKGLVRRGAQGVRRRVPPQVGGVRQPRPAPGADGRAGHRQGAHVPGRRPRHRVRVRRQHPRAVRQHPRVQPVDARRGRLRRRRTACSCRPTSRSPTPSWPSRSSRRSSTDGATDDPDQVGPRPRRRRQPLRRPLAGRPGLRPVLVDRQRGRRPPRRAPRRHRLPEVRRRLVGGPRDASSATSTPSSG